MRFINPLTMMQQALLAQPGGAPAPAPQYMNQYAAPMQQMVDPAQQFLPQVQNMHAVQDYYGPAHKAVSDYFTSGLQWRTDFPRYVNQLMFDPEKVAMHSGSTVRDIIAPQPNNDWRINWFPPTPEGDATKAAVAQAGGLLQPATIDTGVRAGQNDVPGGGL